MTSLRTYMLLLLLLLGIAAESRAQSSSGPEGFPVAYGPTNVGRDFWLSFPANWDYAASFKYVRLYITSGVRTRVKVWTGANLLTTVFTKPNDIITVDLPLLGAQPFTRDDRAPVPDDQIYPNKAVHIESDDPIVVYGINRITYTSDGLLAIPTQGLGKEYIVASAPDIADGSLQRLPSQYVITAPYDNTIVTIINTFDTPNHRAGQAVTITMQKGDVYSAMSSGPLGDLTGTIITSNLPIAVTTGQNCTYLPRFEFPACDHLCEMMLPVSAWGKVYHLVPFANRLKGDYIRVFAGAPKAKIILNGQQIATLNNKGGYEGEAWLQLLPPQRELMEFISDKPIYVAQYNNSQTYDGVQTDPFFLGLTPVEQYQTGLTFTTPSNDYPQNFINLVLDSTGWHDIEIAPGGTEDWKKLSTVAGTTPKNFPTLVNGVRYQGLSFEIDPGTYRMRGKKPFAGYIYGWSSFDSYGYPLSVAVGNLSLPDTVAPTISFTQDCDGNVTVTTTDLPARNDIRSNLSTIELDPKSVNYQIDDPLTVRRKLEPAGTVETTTFKMSVIDRSKDAMAIIVISDGRGNTSRDTVYYSAFNVAFDGPDPVYPLFGPMNKGLKLQRSATLRNNGDRAITIKEVILQKGNVGFRIVDPLTEFTLGPKGSGTDTKVVTVEFTATVAGTFEDMVGVRDTCGPHMLEPLKANVGTPKIFVSNYDFDEWPISAPQPKEGRFRIENQSIDGGELIVYGVASGPTDGVVFKTPDGYPIPFPMTIVPGTPVEVRVTFKPSQPIPYTDAILFNHNAGSDPGNDSVALLEGIGINSLLLATPKDWGERRVGSGPYIDSVKVENIGNQDIRIIDANPASNSDFVLIDRAKVQNLTLRGNESIWLKVSFAPTAVGPREMVIVYDHNAGDAQVTSKLEGIGTVPLLLTHPLDFGTMAVGAPEVELETKFYGTGQYFDSVTVTGFELVGDPDFRYELPAGVTLPVMLGSLNDTLRVRSFFSAQANGGRSAALKAITLDNVDATSNWIGRGASGTPKMLLSATRPDNVCDSALVTVTVRNIGDEPLSITGYSLAGTGDGNFRLIDPVAPFTLAPGEEKQITLMFVSNPAGAATQTDNLNFTSDDPDNTNETITLAGNRQAPLTVRTSTALSSSNGTRGVFGKDIIATVALDESVATRNVNGYSVTLRFDAKQLNARLNGITLLEANPNGSTFTFDNSQLANGILVVNVTTNGPLTNTGRLLNVPFGVTWDQALSRSITSEVTTGAGCLAITGSAATIDIEPICGFSVRLIELSASKYALGQNSPNPGGPTTKIEYSLGLDGPTKMELFDANGDLVQVLLDEHQQPGAYEVTLDVNNLTSGLYFYRITSGDWTETRQMTIKK